MGAKGNKAGSPRNTTRKRKLNLRQKRFVAEYLQSGNAADAYRRAGYEPASAEFDGPRLLRSDQVRAAIDAATDELNPATVLRELLRIATVDIADAYDDNGNLLPLKEMPKDVRRAIASVKVQREKRRGSADDGEYERETTEDVEVRFHPKVESLGLLGKHFKLFTDKIQHEVGKSFADLVNESAEGGKDGRSP